MIEAGFTPLLKSASFCRVFCFSTPASESRPAPATARPLVPWQLAQVAARLRPRLGSAAWAAPASRASEAAAIRERMFIVMSPPRMRCSWGHRSVPGGWTTVYGQTFERSCCVATILALDYIRAWLYIKFFVSAKSDKVVGLCLGWAKHKNQGKALVAQARLRMAKVIVSGCGCVRA